MNIFYRKNKKVTIRKVCLPPAKYNLSPAKYPCQTVVIIKNWNKDKFLFFI